MGIVGCYSTDIYCDDPRRGHGRCTAFPGQFTGSSEAATFRRARKAGWLINKRGKGAEGAGRAVCPLHANYPARPPEESGEATKS